MSINHTFKTNFKRAIMWAALALIILLIFLSIYGAFIGPARARGFFNSVPLAVYWAVFALLVGVGIAAFRRLLHVPALLLIHAGCIFILTGAIWGSDDGHKLRKKRFGIDKIPTGQMVIYEGTSQNRVAVATDEELRKLLFSVDQQGRIEYYWQDGKNLVMLEHRELPFYIGLKDFRLEYYKPEYIHIMALQGQSWRFPIEIGAELALGPDLGTITVTRVFRNFKISIEGDRSIATDEPGPGSNPALEVRIKSPNGRIATRYVFERFPSHIHTDDELLMSYQRIISDYVSQLQVIRDGKVIAEKDIEVNHPLHFGGYHFYQHSYDDQAGQYTILTVTSDTGLTLVYAGYWMLCIGVFWHFWLRQLHDRKKRINGN